MTNEERFSQMKEYSNFEIDVPNFGGRYHKYAYRALKGDKEEWYRIYIPKNAKYKISWDPKETVLEELPEWFKERLDLASSLVQKRDKIRKAIQ